MKLQLTGVLVATLLGACAAAPESGPPEQVAYLPPSILAAPGATMPDVDYLSSGQPTPAALERLAAAGFAGVVDLRTADERRGFDEAAVAEMHGLRYESLPVAGSAGVTFENAATLEAILASFDGPVLLHCASGNRVGALLALRAKAAGADDTEALAAGRAAGLTDLERVVRGRLAEAD